MTMVLECSYIGNGAYWCSLNLSSKVLEDSPVYSSSHSTLSHLYLYMTPLFLKENLILVLRLFQSYKRGVTNKIKNKKEKGLGIMNNYNNICLHV